MGQSRSISLAEVKESAGKFLLLDDDNMIDVAMATYVANKFNSDPLWMFFTGPPSSAKTEILRALDGHENVLLLSSLTPSTLISGQSIKTKKGSVNCSLLPKLSNKLLVIKDFGTILTLYREARGEIFAQLREVYDGKYSKAFGTGEKVEWNGKIGILAGVTPAIDKYMSVNAMLGERFLHYRMGGKQPYGVGLCAFDAIMGETGHRKEFQLNVNQFLSRFDGKLSVNLQDDKNIKERMVALSVFCAHARSAVYRNRRDQTLEAMPEPEGPGRLTKQFRLLALALAIVRDQREIDNEIYQIVKKVAVDTLPRLRHHILEALWKMYQAKGVESWHTTKEIALTGGIPTTTAKLKLENLNLLKLVDRRTEGEGSTAAYIWKPSKLMESLVSVSEAFTSTETANNHYAAVDYNNGNVSRSSKSQGKTDGLDIDF